MIGKNTKIMIGQGVTASLSALGTLSNWKWTLPGKIFSEFKVTRPDGAKGNVVEVAADENTKANPHWHWKEKTTAIVVGSADVTIDGEMIGNITAERTVEVLAPNFTFEKSFGVVIKIPYNNTAWSIGPKGASGHAGCDWTSSSSPPPPFVGGRWHFVQIITPYRHRTFYPGTTPVADPPGNNTSGLDNTYAYAPDPFLPDPQAPGGYSDTEKHRHGDSPYMNVNDTVKHLTVHDKYEVFLMYEPPVFGSQDVQWVPLHSLKWEWNTDVERPGTTWGVPMSNLGTVGPAATVPGGPSVDTDFPPFPFWEMLQTNPR